MAKLCIPRYKPWDIENIAQEFLKVHWDPAKGWVDIEAIAEQELDLLIDVTRAEAFNVLGSICRRQCDGRLLIVVNEETFNRRPLVYRFTLAQEVGHLLLHKDIIEAIVTLDDLIDFQEYLSDKQYKWLESDVNRCAAAILMPQHQFTDAACDLYEYWCEQINGEGIKIRTGGKYLQKRIVTDLAKQYQVNPMPAKIRLQNWPIQLYDKILKSAQKGLSFVDRS